MLLLLLLLLLFLPSVDWRSSEGHGNVLCGWYFPVRGVVQHRR